MKIVFLLIVVIIALIFICIDGNDKNKRKIKENTFNHVWVLRDLVDRICQYYQEKGKTGNLLYKQCEEFVRRHSTKNTEKESKFNVNEISWAKPVGKEERKKFSTEDKRYYYIIDAYSRIIDILKSSNYPDRFEIREIIKEWKEEQGDKINIYITGENPIKSIEL